MFNQVHFGFEWTHELWVLFFYLFAWLSRAATLGWPGRVWFASVRYTHHRNFHMHLKYSDRNFIYRSRILKLNPNREWTRRTRRSSRRCRCTPSHFSAVWRQTRHNICLGNGSKGISCFWFNREIVTLNYQLYKLQDRLRWSRGQLTVQHNLRLHLLKSSNWHLKLIL